MKLYSAPSFKSLSADTLKTSEPLQHGIITNRIVKSVYCFPSLMSKRPPLLMSVQRRQHRIKTKQRALKSLHMFTSPRRTQPGRKERQMIQSELIHSVTVRPQSGGWSPQARAASGCVPSHPSPWLSCWRSQGTLTFSWSAESALFVSEFTIDSFRPLIMQDSVGQSWQHTSDKLEWGQVVRR